MPTPWLRTPPAQLRGAFFDTEEFRAAFASEHIGKVFKVYRNHPRHLQLFGKALNQELLGRWLDLTQAQVSKLENGKPEQNLDALRSYAKSLHLPQHLLWFDLPGRSRLILPGPTQSTSDETGGGEVAARDDLLIAHTGMDTVELIRRIRASAIDPATTDALSITIEQLCCDYAHVDARELIATGKEWLGKTTELLANRLTLLAC